MARPADPHARSSLLTAARREFVRSGIQKARIEDITQACGLSKGAFYLHFESKEALFREVVHGLEREFEALRQAREDAYAELISRGVPSRRRAGPFITELTQIDAREDRRLLELLWNWRDVTDVLLRGSQGTEFEGILWEMLDREVSRVELECRALKDAKLMRDDVPGDVVGLMIVGTYLLVARKLSTLTAQPDFEHWVRSLQTLIAEGTSSPELRARLASPPKKKKPVRSKQR
jgi:AcrR family transcriptional regulator